MILNLLGSATVALVHAGRTSPPRWSLQGIEAHPQLIGSALIALVHTIEAGLTSPPRMVSSGD